MGVSLPTLHVFAFILLLVKKKKKNLKDPPILNVHINIQALSISPREIKRLQKPLNSTGSGQVTAVCSCFLTA